MTVAIWLGAAAPARTIRWLDGALGAAAKFTQTNPNKTPPVAIAAGDPTWLDLATDRATRAGLTTIGVATDLQLDYLGWAQVVAAAARHVGATTILVDEASRAERFPEVAAIADLVDAAQLTHVVSIAPDNTTIHASRASGSALQVIKISGPAVIGLRIAGAAIDEYPTPTPSASMKRLDLAAIGLDPAVIAHRALPPRAGQNPRHTIERVAEHLAVHVVPRSPRTRSG